MHATVEATRVVFGSEFIPRAGSAPDNLIVRAGTTVGLPEDATYRYVEVGGTLRISRQVDTILRYVDLVILPGGVLDIGTEEEPNLRQVELIGRNTPIDTAVDPYQWGHGLVNFGTQYRVGRKKAHAIALDAGLVAGQTVVKLPFAPEGWEVGDELQMPDTDQPSPARQPRQERAVFIARLEGTTLTLSKGLDFDHLPITDPEGVPHVFPRILNLTRNIVVRSEDVAGVPTHTADIGMHAISDVRFNRIEGCGRTTAAVLDNSAQNGSAITHVGTNQVGKYADHLHHAMGHMSRREGNVLVGHPGSKWGLVVHGTHDVRVERNIATWFPGASFITEDGPETRNEFRHNIATFSRGAAGAGDAPSNMHAKRPGVEGTGFWMHGVRNRYVGNEAWNCSTGFNLFNQQQQFYNYPSGRGGAMDKPFDEAATDIAVPLEMAGQVLACNNGIGMDWWATREFPNQDLTTVYNGSVQGIGQTSQHIAMVMTGKLLVLGKGGTTTGLEASSGYMSILDISGDGFIAGCRYGIGGGGGIFKTRLQGLTMQNVIDYDFEFYGRDIVIADALNKPMPGRSPQFLKIGTGKVWDGNGPPARVFPHQFWVPNGGTRQRLKNWQRTGQDYEVFQPQQLDTAIAHHSSQDPQGDAAMFFCPERGRSMLYSWETYGVAWAGGAAKAADCVSLPGVLNCVLRPGWRQEPSGPPSAVMTSPTMREPAIVRSGSPSEQTTRLYVVLVGAKGEADDVVMVSIDGGRPTPQPQSRYQEPGARDFDVTNVSPGTHTVDLWRRHKGTGAELPGSRRTFKYFVGTP